MLEKVLDENFVKIETAEDDTSDWYEVTPGSCQTLAARS